MRVLFPLVLCGVIAIAAGLQRRKPKVFDLSNV